MKKVISIVLSLIMLVTSVGVTGVTAFAEWEPDWIYSDDGDWCFELQPDGSVSVDGYYGTEQNVVIPSSFEGKTVKQIDEFAFSNAVTIESITLPNTIETIAVDAFRFSSAKTINLNEGVKNIGDYAFCDCENLKSIVLPSTIITFGRDVFSNCISLESIDIRFAIKEIPENTFYSCSSLSQFTIPNTVTSVGDYAFDETSITYLEFPQSVSYVGFYSFPKNVKTLVFRNPQCVIADSIYSNDVKICGYAGSTAEACANYWYVDFIDINTPCFPNGHNYVYTVFPATCTADGYTAYVCSGCGKMNVVERLYSTGHNFMTNGYCSVCGAYDAFFVVTPVVPVTPTVPETPVVPVTPSAPATSTQTVKTSKKVTVSAPKISKVTKGKKSFKVTWKKVSGVKGYQVQYSTDKKFKKGTKTTTIKSSKTTSKTVNKLKAKKKYYVRVRAYKIVNGKAVYSKWSSSKTVTTK